MFTTHYSIDKQIPIYTLFVSFSEFYENFDEILYLCGPLKIRRYYILMNSFAALGLNDELVSALNDLGFENPTPIQEQAIPYLLGDQSDFVGLAQTGTGKTAAFGLPLLQHLDLTSKETQALVICPTRELCLRDCQ